MARVVSSSRRARGRIGCIQEKSVAGIRTFRRRRPCVDFQPELRRHAAGSRGDPAKPAHVEGRQYGRPSEGRVNCWDLRTGENIPAGEDILQPHSERRFAPAGHPCSSLLRMPRFRRLLPNHSSFFDGHAAFARIQRQALPWAGAHHPSCARGSLTIKPRGDSAHLVNADMD